LNSPSIALQFFATDKRSSRNMSKKNFEPILSFPQKRYRQIQIQNGKEKIWRSKEQLVTFATHRAYALSRTRRKLAAEGGQRFKGHCFQFASRFKSAFRTAVIYASQKDTKRREGEERGREVSSRPPSLQLRSDRRPRKLFLGRVWRKE